MAIDHEIIGNPSIKKPRRQIIFLFKKAIVEQDADAVNFKSGLLRAIFV